MEETKACKCCGAIKPLSYFYNSKKSPCGKQAICKECQHIKNKEYYEKNKDKERARNKAYRTENKNALTRKKWEQGIRYKYGISLEEFNKLLYEQGGVCAICKRKVAMPGLGARRKDTFVVDHDHTTGVVRGILCGNCNTALGQFRESIEVLAAAIRYLEKGEKK